jgi:hypothetical protein
MPFVVQPITKLVNPLRGRTCLEIIPLLVQTFTIHVLVNIVFNRPVEVSERFDRD